MAHQISGFYLDLQQDDFVSAFALVHSRFSTNTLGHWRLAHPYRYLAHNGEINTLRGNLNWMHARESMFESPLFGGDMGKIPPVMTAGDSDTASFDNALELLLMTGRELDHAMLMMIPERGGTSMRPCRRKRRTFTNTTRHLMEPWDGPAMIVSSDGRNICALLDRNGLRPFRYLVTSGDKLVMASETGVLDVPPAEVRFKGRLQPGRMFMVSLEQGRIIGDEELKHGLANRQPYGQWLEENKVDLDSLPTGHPAPSISPEEVGQAAAGVRLQRGRVAYADGADGGVGLRGRGFHGQRRAAGGAVGAEPVGIQLLQAVVCAGDESSFGRHPRGTGDVSASLSSAASRTCSTRRRCIRGS